MILVTEMMKENICFLLFMRIYNIVCITYQVMGNMIYFGDSVILFKYYIIIYYFMLKKSNILILEIH